MEPVREIAADAHTSLDKMDADSAKTAKAPVPTYHLVDGARHHVRHAFSLDSERRLQQVTEYQDHVLVLGPTRQNWKTVAEPDLSGTDPDKPRLYVHADRYNCITATDKPEIFALAMGGSDRDATMRVEGFTSGQDKIAAIDLYGLAQPQRIAHGSFTGHKGEWRINGPVTAGYHVWRADYDADGDGKADYLVRITPSSGKLTEDDFLLGSEADIPQSPPTYEALDALRPWVRTAMSLYQDERIVQVLEEESDVKIFGPLAADNGETENPDLSSISPGKTRIFIPVDSMFAVSGTPERDIFLIAAGGTAPDGDLVISNFQPGFDKVVLLDLDGLPHAQTAVYGSFSELEAQWCITSPFNNRNYWHVDYDQDGNGEADYFVSVQAAYGRFTARDILLGDAASAPVTSDWTPPGVSLRLQEDLSRIAELVDEHLDKSGQMIRNLENTVLVFGSDEYRRSSLSPELEPPTKPAVFMASPETRHIICSESQDVIAHFDGLERLICGVSEFEHHVDKFAVLGGPGPVSIHQGTRFTESKQWIYNAFDKKQLEKLGDYFGADFKSIAPEEKVWLVQYDGNGDREADLTYVVWNVDRLDDSDFLA